MSLIEELEKAEKPSRELDAAIAEASGWIRVEADKFFAESWLNPDEEDAILPTFSSSIDAALTLVPEGWALSHLEEYADRGRPETWGWGATLRNRLEPQNGVMIGEVRGADLAPVAICIAALRARETTNGTT